jgi:beta-lactamase superfamily II metal-dependent hydrolase
VKLTREVGPVRNLPAAIMAVILIALAASPAAAWSIAIQGSGVPLDTPPPPLEIHLLGRSVLIRTPGGRSLLFDAGPDVTPEALWELGVGRLNVLVVTAAEPGRTENLGQLLRRLPVDEVFDSGYGPRRLADLPPGYRLFLEELAARGIPYRLARAGERVEPEPGVALEFLSPRGFRPHPAQHAVAARLVHGETRLILAGALDALALARVRDWLGDDLRADAWLVGSPPDPLPAGALVLAGPQSARFQSDGVRLERLADR